MKGNGGGAMAEGGNACKTKTFERLAWQKPNWIYFFFPKSVMMDARESCKKSGVQMHLFLMAKCKTLVDSWCLQMIPGNR